MSVVLEDRRIAQLVHRLVDGTVPRWFDWTIGTFPRPFRAKDLDGIRRLPRLPVVGEVDGAAPDALRSITDTGPVDRRHVADLVEPCVSHRVVEQDRPGPARPGR
ncbi:MAG: hypothetical protein OEU32_00695 [Acidimicrobiia bacterium]|nr:hypothetical protein [Acidimicrobiia bacterium]